MFNVGDITFIVIVTLIIIIEFDSARTDNQITTIKLPSLTHGKVK